MDKPSPTKVFTGAERTLILRVLRFFEEEKRLGEAALPVDAVMRRTCAATGVSLSTLTRIKNEEKKMLESQGLSPPPKYSPCLAHLAQEEPSLLSPKKYPIMQLTTPGLKRPRVPPKSNIDEATVEGLQNIIERFYKMKETPSAKKVLAIAKNELNFTGQEGTLRKVLKDRLGFRFDRWQHKKPNLKVVKKNSDLSTDKPIETEHVWVSVKKEEV